MFAKLTKAALLSACLVAAGAAGSASADERDLVVPMIAGAAVGALIATNWDNNGHHHPHEPRYAPRPQPVMYVPAPQPVYYQPAPPPPHRPWDHHGEGRRFDGPPRW